MTPRSRKLWVIGMWLFTLLNVGGAVFAARAAEPLHAAAHLALSVVGALVLLRLRERPQAQQAKVGREFGQRLDHLQQSVDAVALEVERLGEAQRYTAKVAAERIKAAEADRGTPKRDGEP
jgi:hypothetical protein